MKENDIIYVAGHTGLIGSALVTRLENEGFRNIITRTSSELDLADREAVRSFFRKEKPEYIFLLAARVGGIVANDAQPVDFIHTNLLIECNLIGSAWETGAKKLLLLGCACVYPKKCSQPIKEEYLLAGRPEQTNLAHAMAKISGIVMCQSYNKQYNTDFIVGISANVIGPGDNFDLVTAHVVPSLINRFHSAKVRNERSVTIWGSGKPRRDFIYVDDVVDACLFLMDKYDSSEVINISAGVDISISELAELIKDVAGYRGEIVFDRTKPDGMPKKLLDGTRLSSMGWKPKGGLRDAIIKTYRWYESQRH